LPPYKCILPPETLKPGYGPEARTQQRATSSGMMCPFKNIDWFILLEHQVRPKQATNACEFLLLENCVCYASNKLSTRVENGSLFWLCMNYLKNSQLRKIITSSWLRQSRISTKQNVNSACTSDLTKTMQWQVSGGERYNRLLKKLVIAWPTFGEMQNSHSWFIGWTCSHDLQ